MKKQKIEDIFSSIENFSSVPPPELWSKIEEELDKPKKKKRVVLWWSAAACLLLGLLLPSVLHFTADSGISTPNNESMERSVVLDENKKDLNNKTVTVKNDNTEKEIVVTESSAIETSSNQSAKPQKNKLSKTTSTGSDSNSRINFGIAGQESNTVAENTNQAAVKEKIQVSGKQNSFNSFSNHQIPNSVKNTENEAVAEKTFSTQKQNSFNSISNHQIPNSVKNTENQAVAEKTFSTQKQNSFNSISNHQIPNSVKNTENQAVAEKTFSTQKQNSFNSFSNHQMPNSVQNTKNQAFAEKPFSTQKQNSLNTFSNHQIPNSALEEKTTSKNAAIIALNPSNSTEENNFNNKEEAVAQNNNLKIASTEFTPKNNVTLSKQDSIQLVQLQNLEKGIAEVEIKKDKETKAVSNSEKWSLEVFAGIANSENYGNQKTLGNVNESKQTNSYGVKTNYKLNKKWAVSSGLKFNELGQSIANVSFYNYSQAASSPLTSGILYYDIQAINAPKITNNSGYVFVSKSTQNTFKSDNVESGNIDQSLKYIEMPLEVSYFLFNKNKTNISLNTGGFVGKLISNDVTLNGNSIGDNLNASDFVYGTLLSSTLQYRLYKKTHVFVEPGMNYYINPLNNQTFNQFQWSLNFGLNVSF